MTLNLQDIECRLLDLNQRAEEIAHRAEGESRDLTNEEGLEIDRILNDASKLMADRDRLRELAAQSQRLSEAVGRRTEPDDVAANASNSVQLSDAPQQRRAFAAPKDPKTLSNYGWPSFGQFAKGVMLASRRTNPVVDPRLTSNAPTDYMREGVGEDGGFAVPPDYRTAIMRMVMGEDSLLARTDQQQSASNTFSQPVDVSTPYGTGGIKAYWTEEGAQKTQSSPDLRQNNLRLHKLAALVPVTDELREDATAIDGYLRSKTPDAFTFAINEAILRGTGVGMPQGILTSAALITVNAEAGQAAGTLHANNVVKMWGRLHAQYRNDAVWLVNQDVETQFPGMASAATTPDGATVVGTTATYWEPGSLRNNNNFGLLYNRPVIVTESCSPLGQVGDIVLASLSQYLTVTKVGGLRSDVSIHLWFDYDITAFRFVMRVAGGPWLQAPIPRRGSNTNTLSAFVTLAAR